MTLLVALDYKTPGEEDVGMGVGMGGGGMMGEGKEENAFRYFISKLVSQASHLTTLNHRLDRRSV